MEKFWNILHYFIFKIHHKATYYFYKYIGVFKLYNLPWTKKRFKNKFNINNPQQYLMNWWGNPYYGGSLWFSYILLNLAFMPPSLIFAFVYIHWYIRNFGNPSSPLPFILVIVCWGVIITLISHIYLIRNDKYIKYIRLYDKQPRKWKIKWGCISIGIIILPLLITILYFSW